MPWSTQDGAPRRSWIPAPWLFATASIAFTVAGRGGVPPGTLVNGTLEFRLDGWSEQNCGGAGCGVRLEGWLAAGTDSLSTPWPAEPMSRPFDAPPGER